VGSRGGKSRSEPDGRDETKRH
jgi:hypothetical protein